MVTVSRNSREREDVKMMHLQGQIILHLNDRLKIDRINTGGARYNPS